MKPFVHVMSRYITMIESGNQRNVLLTQFVAFIFLRYLVHNVYVIWRYIDVSRIFEPTRSDGKDSKSV